jgi:hypothetical protein
MVATRRSPKKAQSEVASDVPQNSQRASTLKTKAPKSSVPKDGNRRKKQNDEIQSKNTGLGISIEISGSSKQQSKKIVFDEDEIVTADDPEKVHALDAPQGVEKGAPSDDDVDDAVEEVKGSSAREEVLHQLQLEEKGAVKTKKTKKRKERRNAKEKDPGDDDLDDDFFAQLETVRAEEEQKKMLASRRKKSKHTTFVFDEINQSPTGISQPISMGHNIQVVVLPELEEMETDDVITAQPLSSLPAEALLYARCSLPDGSDKGGKRKRGSPNLPDTSWKRSRKMNLILSSKARFHRVGGRGLPAANFATKGK